MAEQTNPQERSSERPRMVDQTPTMEMTNHLFDANQRILREWSDLSAHTLREGARAYAETMQNGLDLVREMQTASIRWNPFWPEAFSDPLRWYQRALTDTVEGAQRALQAMTATARATMESCERLQHTAEQAGRRVQETVGSAAKASREGARKAA